MATCRQVREAALDLLDQLFASATQQRSESLVKTELRAMQAHEVQDVAVRLAHHAAQATAKLLQEESPAVRGPQHQQRVDGRHIDTFVEEIHREDDVEPALR